MNIQVIKSISMVNNYKILNKKPEKKENLNSFDNSISSKCASNYAIAFLRKPKPIYAIDKNGNYTKFSSLTEAAKVLNVHQVNISQSINNKQYRYGSGGYIFVHDYEIETKDSNGKTIIDEEKIQELLAFKQSKKLKKAVYAFDKDGNYTRYESITKASKKTGSSLRSIEDVITNRRSSSKGLIFVRANDIETKDENGNDVLDKSKIQEMYKARSATGTKKAVYLIRKNGKYKKYDSVKAAKNAIKCSKNTIFPALAGKKSKAKKYAIVYAKDVETRDENGRIVVLEDKLEDKKKKAFS